MRYYFFGIVFLFSAFLSACNNPLYDGPHVGEWKLYAASVTAAGPAVVASLEFFPDGKVIASGTFYEETGYAIHGDTLLISYNNGLRRYILSFPHPDTMWIDNQNLNDHLQSNIPNNAHGYFRIH